MTGHARSTIDNAGPREVLIAASDPPGRLRCSARADRGEPEPTSRSGGNRPSWVLAGLLVAVALIGFVVCRATDVIA